MTYGSFGSDDILSDMYLGVFADMDSAVGDQ